ncbi:MAG: nucleotidyl transferase AbiEii/AbiGii toxin family protein [Pseudomonadota bacterium]
MGPIELLESAVRALRKVDCRFAVAGGIAANLFRSEPRLTQDVDLLLLADPIEKTEEIATRFLQKLGFEVGRAKVADLVQAQMMGKKTTPVVLLVGREKGTKGEGGVDILLPKMAWVQGAIERAQHHRVDFGFGKLPTITIEDFIVSKLFALRDNPSRFKDLDDLQSLFGSNPSLDLVYLAGAFGRYHLTLPRELRRLAPKGIRAAARRPG